jgi:Ser/Thr protein kinase RdoA (MazF antagonist)
VPQASGIDRPSLARIAGLFRLPAPVATVGELGNGNVNDTFLVTLAAEGAPRYVLQRLNTRVFREPRLVMANMLALAEHVERRLGPAGADPAGRRWEVPRVVLARHSGEPWVEEGEEFWRMITFLECSRSFDTITGNDQAREVGYGLARFHGLIADLPVTALADTLEGFHVTPGYLARFHAALPQARPETDPRHRRELEGCLHFVQERERDVTVLEDAREQGRLQLRPIHGDPKVNNVMIDVETGRAIGLVDLDTVKPGLIHYDIGDCLRSGCNPLGEEALEPEAVHFDLERCEAILRGYLDAGRDFLTPADHDYIYAAIRLISFELGLRFLTDHLEGDVYFKTRYPGHNLHRARVQFRLTESIEAQEQAIRALIEALR